MSLVLRNHGDGVRRTLVGTKAASFTIVIVDAVGFIQKIHGAVRTDIQTDAARLAGLEVQDRALIPPATGEVFQGGFAFHDGPKRDLHGVSPDRR
jgi:hypothetical protein